MVTMNALGTIRLVGAGLAAAALTACSATAATPLLGHVTVSAGKSATATTPSSTSSSATTTSLQPVQVPSSAASDGAAALQSAFVQVVSRVSPSVVEIETPAGLGSGVVYDSKGDIVTNAHVVGRYSSFTVTDYQGNQYQGSLVGTDPSVDLAVIQVGGARLTPAQFADSKQLEVGDLVMAIGNPFGLQGSVTQGLVSAVDRDVAESRSVTLSGLIQTSAPNNPGNTGGALVDLAGQVVGIPTLGATSADGIGFAISSDQVVSTATQLIGGPRS